MFDPRSLSFSALLDDFYRELGISGLSCWSCCEMMARTIFSRMKGR